MRPVDKQRGDLYCLYCPDTDACYFLDSEEFDKSVNLRVETPKNNQRQHIKFAVDYRRVP